MAHPLLHRTPVLVVGAGLMGSGIAQVAAQAGHPVRLFDTRAGAALDARARLAATLAMRVDKGRLPATAAAAALDRIAVIDRLEAAADSGLVIEAIVEDPAAKRALFEQLEAFVGKGCILASNTSSISITALAAGLRRPGRVLGLHFFNPAPLMKLVEVVSGLATEPVAADAVAELAAAWGKVPVHAKSTPGFIVNRIARPYYAEALALLQEQAATPAQLDAALRGAGFRMGPCELMDLIGHDTNLAVTQSVWEANFHDARYRPSRLQREMVDGGLLGRKSGRGFYRYPNDRANPADASAPAAPPPGLPPGALTVHGTGAVADALEAAASRALALSGVRPARERRGGWVGLSAGRGRLVLTDGRCAQALAGELGSADMAVFDRPLQRPGAVGTPLALAFADGASEAWRMQSRAWLAALGYTPLPVADTPGLLVARTVAMLVNEAADAVQQGVCTPEGADAAMTLGLNWPQGPFEWLAGWGAAGVVALLDRLDEAYRGERYRASPLLRRRTLLPP